MSPTQLGQIIALYTWFVLVALLLIVFFIGRFYERFSNKRTFSPILFVIMAGYGAAMIRYATLDEIVSDPLGDILFAGSGILLFIYITRVYLFMVDGKRKE